jgi:DNA helicase-2/ATP-dependent DNA helicase PcrA
MSPSAQIQRLRALCEPLFERRYPAPLARLNDVDQLAHVAAAHPSRAALLAALVLDPPVSTEDLAGPPLLDEEYLILSTMHSAKGCEWDIVHLIHAADGIIPSDMATGDEEDIEEERRLLYVAMTRARNDLHIYFPLRYYHRPSGLDDAHGYAQPSRFLMPAVHAYLDRGLTAGARVAPEAARSRGQGDARAVDAFLESLWDA